MKGIVLAGGAGSRLYPMTVATSKQLLSVYDKPMIYYPLSVLMLADIREIVVVTTPEQRPLFERLLGDGSAFGLALDYREQRTPGGIAEAFLIAEDRIAGERVALVLGDNLFVGENFIAHLRSAEARTHGATIFTTSVADPERFGIVELDADERPMSIAEKPREPRSNLAVTGLYFYDEQVLDIVRGLATSARGELEITDVNARYLERGELHAEVFGRAFTWLDCGTPDSLVEASLQVQSLQRRQGLLIGCLEEIAYRKGWVSAEAIRRRARIVGTSGYARYLEAMLEGRSTRPGP